MNFTSISEKIILLEREDSKLRNELIKKGTLSKGYNKEMETLHNRNAKELSLIMDSHGYPTSDKVGKEAGEAAWLIIQHSIGQPDFIKKCAVLLKEAVDENKEDPKYLAYLTDRIAVFEGKPQLYGTQFDWDESGKMNPNPFDDLLKVNHRRRSIGLNTLEDQIKVMRERVKSENQHPPKNFEVRKQEFDEWRKTVGWIK